MLALFIEHDIVLMLVEKSAPPTVAVCHRGFHQVAKEGIYEEHA